MLSPLRPLLPLGFGEAALEGHPADSALLGEVMEGQKSGETSVGASILLILSPHGSERVTVWPLTPHSKVYFVVLSSEGHKST